MFVRAPLANREGLEDCIFIHIINSNAWELGEFSLNHFPCLEHKWMVQSSSHVFSSSLLMESHFFPSDLGLAGPSACAGSGTGRWQPARGTRGLLDAAGSLGGPHLRAGPHHHRVGCQPSGVGVLGVGYWEIGGRR